MRCPILQQLPPPPSGKTGWPWTEEAPQLPAVMPSGAPWPRISLVTPSFNQGDFIEETIRSILLQGYPCLEYFLLDGGSTDGTLEVIRKYAPWISSWASEKDRGQSHAINKGFSRCTGDILTFQNSDDFYLPGTLHNVAQRFIENPDCGAVVGAFRRCDGGSKLLGEIVPSKLQSRSPRDLTLGPPGAYRLHQVSTFYVRHSLDAVGARVNEALHYVMDRELLYRICRQSRIVLASECYGVFRLHENSKTVASVLPFAREFADLYLQSFDGCAQKDRLRRRMANYRIASGHLKLAKNTSAVLPGIYHLIKAGILHSALLGQRSYARAWLQLLRSSPSQTMTS